MKSHTLTQRILRIAVIFILMLACMNIKVFATEPTDPSGDPVETTTPYIEFKIKTTKLEDNSKQVLVECWGKDFENLVGLDFVFQYDNNKLTPSYLDEAGKVNQVLSNIDKIQYANKDKLEVYETQEAYINDNLETLSNSFKLNSELINAEENPILKTYVLRYEESKFDGENEIAKTIMVSISKNDLITPVNSGENGVMIGTFSFRLSDGQSVSVNDFNLIRTLVMCDDGKTIGENGDDDISLYERDITSDDDELNNIEEIAGFVLADDPVGSISGKIQTIYHKKNGEETVETKIGKNIATIKLYVKDQITETNMDKTGNKYTAWRAGLPEEPAYEYTTTKDDNGQFSISEIEYNDYIVVIDKDNYLDYIITNLKIDSTENIDLENLIGIIDLYPGDINKDGQIAANDSSIYNKAYLLDKKNRDPKYDLNDDNNFKLNDQSIFNTAFNIRNSFKKDPTKYKKIIKSLELN